MDGIVISKVSKQYFDVKGNPFLALNQVSFEWRQGENLAVIGESGSGKSTLARLIIGLEKPTSGNIQIFTAGGRSAAASRQSFRMLPAPWIQPILSITMWRRLFAISAR